MLDATGNVYGATALGGANGLGTVFELTPNPSGGWTEQILHNFSALSGGRDPDSNLILDSSGDLYGETFEGGMEWCPNFGCGTAFKLSPISGGGWKETILTSFSANKDGGFPTSPLVFDSEGNLYGTTAGGWGAAAYYGTVFEIKP